MLYLGPVKVRATNKVASMMSIRRVVTLLAAPAVVALLDSAASAQVKVDAGADKTLPHGVRLYPMKGRVKDLTLLDFWVADGDNATENKLLKYREDRGVVSVGPLKTAAGRVYGWPSDFERIKGQLYGIETFDRVLYTLNPTTGLCTAVGSASSYTRLFGLAYDGQADKLYAVDQNSRKLITINYSTGKTSLVLTLPKAHTNIRSLAHRLRDGKLYYTDDTTETLYRVDPVSGVNETVMALSDGPNAIVDELDFFHDRLFASWRMFDPAANRWSTQLVQIDFDNNDVVEWGPIIDDCSAHSLVLNSFPEMVYWRQVDGPPGAVIVRPRDPQTTIQFATAGRYTFELVAENLDGTVTSDQVVITLPRPANDPSHPVGLPDTTN